MSKQFETAIFSIQQLHKSAKRTMEEMAEALRKASGDTAEPLQVVRAAAELNSLHQFVERERIYRRVANQLEQPLKADETADMRLQTVFRAAVTALAAEAMYVGGKPMLSTDQACTEGKLRALGDVVDAFIQATK